MLCLTEKKNPAQVLLRVAFTPLMSGVLTDSEVNGRNGPKGILGASERTDRGGMGLVVGAEDA